MNLKNLILNAAMEKNYNSSNRPYIFASNGKLYRTYKIPSNLNYISFGVNQLSSMSVESLEMELEELNQ